MARLTLKLLKIEPPFVIAIDRTEWQLGAAWVNVLTLSIGYKGISIPLFWTVLEEKGCSDNAERGGIVQQFIDEFGSREHQIRRCRPRVCFKGVARLFSQKEDWLSSQNQSQHIDYEQTRTKASRLKDVKDNENRRPGRISETPQIVESIGICRGLP
jgi:hypothetical protein